MNNSFKKIIGEQKGFTLVEIIVALGIFSLIITGLSVSAVQLITGNIMNSNKMEAIRQVQNVGYWVSRDAVQAMEVSTADNGDTPDDLEVLTLTWYEYQEVFDEDGTAVISYTRGEGRRAVYILVDDKLRRDYWNIEYIEDVETDFMFTGTATYIAEYIEYDPENPDLTSFVVSGNNIILTVTATTGGFQSQSETRIYEIQTRPADVVWN